MRGLRRQTGTLGEYLREAERAYLLRTLEACNWNMARTARRAGIARGHVYRLIERHQIERPPERRRPPYGNAAWQSLGV